jgi:hypothetical protein
MVLSMTASRLKNLLPSNLISAARDRFHDMRMRGVTGARKPLRLAGYFLGGIVLANLILMTSAAFRGDAGAVGQAGASMDNAVAPSVEMDVAADTAPLVETVDNSDRPSMANLCADAREKLITGLTLYYLERSRRPDASAEEVMESVSAHTLLSGPADPGAMPTGIPCAG